MFGGLLNGFFNGTEQIISDTEIGDNYSKLMLHCDGADLGTTFTDSAFVPKTVTPTGATTRTGTNEKKFGTAGVFFNGSSYLTTPVSADFDMAFGDFTLDFWVMFNPLAASTQSFISYGNPAVGQDWQFMVNSSGQLRFFAETIVTICDVVTPVIGFVQGTWYHLALVRSGSNMYIYVNGVAQTLTGTFLGSMALPTGATALTIGARSSNLDQKLNTVYMDEIRISKGTARWTSNFSVATSAYTTEAVSSLTVSGLDGNNDGWYTAIFKRVLSATSYVQLRINGDSGANYGYRGIYGQNTTISGADVGTAQTQLQIGVQTGVSGETSFEVVRFYAKSGSVRIIDSCMVDSITGNVTVAHYVGVWNNTVDNITSLSFLSSAGTGHGPGSRLILFKSNSLSTTGTPTGSISGTAQKTWTRIGSVTLGIAASSVTFSNLNGDRDTLYYIAGNFNRSGTSFVNLNFNGDAGTNYGNQLIRFDNTTTAASRSSGQTAAFVINSSAIAAHQGTFNALLWAKSGFLRPLLAHSISDISGTTLQQCYLMSHYWTNTSANITSMVIAASSGNFSVGSTFELYALRPNG